MLATLMSTRHKLESSERRVPQLRKCLHKCACRRACRTFTWWLMWEDPVYCGWDRPWTSGSGFYKKADGTSQEEQVSKEHLSMDSAPRLPSSSSVSYRPDFIQMTIWSSKTNKPFPPKFILVMMLCHRNNRPPKIRRINILNGLCLNFLLPMLRVSM